VGERPWSPLELSVRVSNEARLRVRGEGVDLDAQLQRRTTIDFSGGDPVVRYVTPQCRGFVAGDAIGGRDSHDLAIPLS
jgi:hypothetical protein